MEVSQRSGFLALALIRYLPIDDLVLIVAAYEELYIPKSLNPVEGWFRKLDEELSRYGRKRCTLRTEINDRSKDLGEGNIVDVKYVEGNVCLVIDKDADRYELNKFWVCCPRCSDARGRDTFVLECNNYQTNSLPYVYLTIAIDSQTDFPEAKNQ